MLKVLDEILLSDNVVENFHLAYKNKEFKNWILNILPEIEDCRKLNQDNPWHIYNCLDHILHSVEEMNKQTKGLKYNARRILAYTMLLHDIGKPETKIRRYSKLYKKEVDSFFNHNKASKKIANRVLKEFDFCLRECEIIKTLVDEHDMFMFITLKEDGNKYHRVLNATLLNEKIKELNKNYDGKTLLKYLIMVGRADNKAQNPEMTKNSLKLLDVFNDMLGNLFIKNKDDENTF